ncbi:MAG TPA: SDR family oxidoreductase [Actinomycetota bacterium]|nr:SDR family oxidoreductase [Actinomycetota bacterium]
MATDRAALVTGGSRGIGAATARALAADGVRVAINYLRREDEAARVAGEVERLGSQAVLVPGDVGDPDALEAVVAEAAERLGRLDIFVHCAVTPVARPVLELTPEDWERSMAVNARAFLLGAQLAAARMQGWGRIVGLSATGAHLPRNPRYAALAAAKGAVEALGRYLAVALAPRGITVNCVAPGPTATEAFDAMAGPDPQRLREALAARTPMGRLGRPDDAARLIRFLCSEDAGWVTGQLLVADGGYSLA